MVNMSHSQRFHFIKSLNFIPNHGSTFQKKSELITTAIEIKKFSFQILPCCFLTVPFIVIQLMLLTHRLLSDPISCWVAPWFNLICLSSNWKPERVALLSPNAGCSSIPWHHVSEKRWTRLAPESLIDSIDGVNGRYQNQF